MKRKRSRNRRTHSRRAPRLIRKDVSISTRTLLAIIIIVLVLSIANVVFSISLSSSQSSAPSEPSTAKTMSSGENQGEVGLTIIRPPENQR